MKKALNFGTFVVGSAITALAVDGWWEAGFVIAGVTLAVMQFDYKPSIGEAAIRLLESVYKKIDLLAIEFDREWRPMGGAESEAKRVIITELREVIPPKVQNLIDTERAK
jgi:hypothetical protein